VAISIRKVGERYTAEVTPPHARSARWSTPEPMNRDDLVAALAELGCHQTDIGDSFYSADPAWLSSEPR
jgi:hypothetical protein